MSHLIPETPAEKEFNTSSNYKPPSGYPAWVIRNDYPSTFTERPAWLDVDFTKDPRAYSEAVKKYILQGNVENKFVVQNNKDRDWYHPVWLHYGEKGREPISGVKFAAEIPEKFISENQNRILQCWLCSYFNAPAATVLKRLWADPNKPKWDKDHPVIFPEGSIIFENVYCDVTEKEIYTLKGAPTTDACIAKVDSSGHPIPKDRKDTADTLHLIQTDFAARDNRFPQLGWVFGTFIYDGTKENPGASPWDNLVPIGIQWGNDPTLTQQAHDDGKLSKECWINGHALDLVNSLKGNRPWLGWHGRLDGIVDDFMSTCTSCHATAQLTPDGKPDKTRSLVQKPTPKKIPAGDGPGIWVQEDPAAIQTWFRNVKAGEPFDKDHLSADYNRHVLFGYENFLKWANPDGTDAASRPGY